MFSGIGSDLAEGDVYRQAAMRAIAAQAVEYACRELDHGHSDPAVIGAYIDLARSAQPNAKALPEWRGLARRMARSARRNSWHPDAILARQSLVAASHSRAAMAPDRGIQWWEPRFGQSAWIHIGSRRLRMNVTALIFLIVSVIAVVFLPRRWAPIPLLASCCYMTIGQGIDLGPVSLPVFRIVLAVGLVRVIVRRETIAGGINTIDKLMIAWAVWMVFASFFHDRVPGAGPVYRRALFTTSCWSIS